MDIFGYVWGKLFAEIDVTRGLEQFDHSKLEAFGLFLGAVTEHAGSAELPHGPLFGVSDFDLFDQMITAAGFHEASVRELPIVWRTPSMDSFVASFRDWANLNAFPDQVRDKIESTVRQRARSYRSGDVFLMPNPAILISGLK